ncbi:MAG: hypothetical protein AAF624_09390 [Bacteroidota bacterium]
MTSFPRPWAWVVGLLVGLGGGCLDEIPAEVDTWPVHVAHVRDVQRFAGRSELIALSGRVEAQGGTRALLTDGTGMLWVDVGAPLPDLGAGPLSIRAFVERRRDTLRVRAVEWTYDPRLAPASTSSDRRAAD